MRVEVLAVPDCPNHLPTVELVRRIVRDLDLDADVVEVVIENDVQARAHAFFGSPTVRVEGVDVLEPEERAHARLSCRIYRDGDRTSGVPPRSAIEAALKTRRTDR